MIFDKEELLARTFNDEELIKELLAEFFTMIPGQIEALNRAIKSGESEEAATLAHTLKGTCANMAAKAMAEAALELENAGKTNSLDNAPAFIEKLKVEFNQFKDAVADLGYV